MTDEGKRLAMRINSAIKCGIPHKIIVDKYEDDVINCNDPELSHFFITHLRDSADVNKHINLIVDSGNLKVNFLTAIDFPGANILDHERVILDSKDPDYNCLFALYIPMLCKLYLKYADETVESIRELRNNIDYDNKEVNMFLPYEEGIRAMDDLLNDQNYSESFDDIKIFILDIDVEAHKKIVFDYGDEELIEFFKSEIGDEKNKKAML